MLIGSARVSTNTQDLTAQRDALTAAGVDPDAIYVDHGSPALSVSALDWERHWPRAAQGTLSSSVSSIVSPDRYRTRVTSLTSSPVEVSR
jgi:hypothetical protein